MRTMKSADLIRELKSAGWVLDRVRGSHHVFYHPSRLGHVTVPHPKKD
jgi:predicted RNA binding protein YcfA (HicA-like mRNA interferase family)